MGVDSEMDHIVKISNYIHQRHLLSEGFLWFVLGYGGFLSLLHEHGVPSVQVSFDKIDIHDIHDQHHRPSASVF